MLRLNEGATAKRMLVALISAIVIVALAACGGDDSESSSSETAAKDAPAGPYKVGMFGGFTGFLAPFDNSVKQGAQLRIDELNANGGIDGKYKIEFMSQDSASDPAKARVAASALLDKDAQFLIGTCAGDVSLPGGLLAQKQQIPIIPSCAGDPAFPKKVGDYAFLANPGGLAQGSALGEYAVKEGLKRVYIVGSTFNVYVQAYTDGFKEGFTKAGGEIVGEDSVELFKSSYAPSVQKLQEAEGDYDAVFTPLFVPDSVKLIRGARAAGIDVPFLLDDGNDSTLIFAGGNPGDVRIVSFGDPGERAVLGEFYAAYEEKYGKAPADINAALGATMIDIIEAAVKAAGTTEPSAVAEAMRTLKVDATTGEFDYNGTSGVPKSPIVIRKAGPNKTLEYVTELRPSVVPQP